jgi:hypothetical protein
LSHAKRDEHDRHLKDEVEAGLIRFRHCEFGSPILFVRDGDGLLRICIDYRCLDEVTRVDVYPIPHMDDTLNELKDANCYNHLNLAMASCKFEYVTRTSTRLRFLRLTV